LNAFLSICNQNATRHAKEIDKRISESGAGRLAGMTLAVKDNIAVKHQPATCGSNILSKYISPYDATAIQRLQAEDAIILGKTNMDEFGMGSSTEYSAFGPTRNPHDVSRSPGGSSGGSAAAVAAGMTMAALGTDTGGSIRQPASFCGVVGLRPTYGRISRYGLIAYASSLDQIGFITHSVSECASLLQVTAGHDPKDATSSKQFVPDYHSLLNQDPKCLTIGIPKEYFGDGLNPEVKEAIENIIRRMKDNGFKIVEVSLPHLRYAIAAYYLIAMAEASSNLARFDGIHYKTNPQNHKSLRHLYVKARTKGLGEEVKRRIILGTFILSAGYYDAYYQKALSMRTLICRDFDRCFEQCDVLLGPTTPDTAFKLDELKDNPLQMYLTDIYTVGAPLAGLPAISVSVGLDSKNMPIGLQLTGKAFQEGDLLRLGGWLEKNLTSSYQ
jgi:aspartyl-tRNA(Asn)/glutamyl-tRNA(Gln) amidotransferase subunit A